MLSTFYFFEKKDFQTFLSSTQDTGHCVGKLSLFCFYVVFTDFVKTKRNMLIAPHGKPEKH